MNDSMLKKKIERIKKKNMEEDVYDNIINKIVSLKMNGSFSFEIVDLLALKNNLVDEDCIGILPIGVKRICEFDSDIILISSYGSGVFATALSRISVIGTEKERNEIKTIIENLFSGYSFVDSKNCIFI